MSSLKTWVAVLLIFLLGAVSGAATYHVVRTRIETRLFESKDVVIEIILFRMTRDLDLSAQQRAQVRAALLAGRRDLVMLEKDLVPVVEHIFDRTAGRISAVLTPEQRARFAPVVEKRRQMMQDAVKRAREPVEEERK
ncbi:MAG: hypothetical protein IT186_05325 [Acidobacteria bacterium]|nr:hypothetical protein [Acidobacteriota bacterium]MCG3194758.1 hypothetical protein [Thermoanaerobaculia bacterium]MCK6682821.1 hypothetical protein [Thermoanaerobaculia bacterium]